MGKRKKKIRKIEWVWCPQCCANVIAGDPHTCYDYVEWLVNAYDTDSLPKMGMINIIKKISLRNVRKADFIS